MYQRFTSLFVFALIAIVSTAVIAEFFVPADMCHLLVYPDSAAGAVGVYCAAAGTAVAAHAAAG